MNPRLQPWQGCTLPLSYSRSGEDEMYSDRSFLSTENCHFFKFHKISCQQPECEASAFADQAVLVSFPADCPAAASVSDGTASVAPGDMEAD